jgi:hypothetical protein
MDLKHRNSNLDHLLLACFFDETVELQETSMRFAGAGILALKSFYELTIIDIGP